MMRRTLATALGILLGWLAPLAPVSAQLPGEGPTFQAFIFGDVVYKATDQEDAEGFDLGQMVLHGNAILSDRVLFFGEISLTGRATGYGVEVERAILRYDFNDALKVSAGRYHTAISYWNTAYHHGLWLQGSVARPEAVKFGSRFIPVHFVGAQAEGRIPDSPVTWVVGVGNGRAENIARAGDAGDSNLSRAFLASAGVEPSALLGFRVGGGVYLDQVPAGQLDVDERITSGHLVWDRGAVDFVGEYIHVRHEDDSTGDEGSSDAWYLHLGYRLPGELRIVTPYLRIERMAIDADDPAFHDVLDDHDATVAGVRVDFSPLAALKVEYRRVEVGEGPSNDALYLQASFAAPLFGG